MKLTTPTGYRGTYWPFTSSHLPYLPCFLPLPSSFYPSFCGSLSGLLSRFWMPEGRISESTPLNHVPSTMEKKGTNPAHLRGPMKQSSGLLQLLSGGSNPSGTPGLPVVSLLLLQAS